MLRLRHYIAQKGINTRDKALAEFWRFHTKYNGNRRRSPQEIFRNVEVRRTTTGGWNIYYSVPTRIFRTPTDCRETTERDDGRKVG